MYHKEQRIWHRRQKKDKIQKRSAEPSDRPHNTTCALPGIVTAWLGAKQNQHRNKAQSGPLALTGRLHSSFPFYFLASWPLVEVASHCLLLKGHLNLRCLSQAERLYMIPYKSVWVTRGMQKCISGIGNCTCTWQGLVWRGTLKRLLSVLHLRVLWASEILQQYVLDVVIAVEHK